MVRSTAERVAAVLHRLSTEPNVWVATASVDGIPHLVPLSLSWTGAAIVVVTPSNTVTARNAGRSGRARAALDSADDVAILDTDVAVADLDEFDARGLSDFVERVGWDPRTETGSWSVLTLTPVRVQAWNGVEEIDGRTIMRDGLWLGG